jgi:hypothetical protein
VHGIERPEVDDLAGSERVPVLHAAEHGQVDRVLVLRARGERRGEDDLTCGDPLDRERVA